MFCLLRKFLVSTIAVVFLVSCGSDDDSDDLIPNDDSSNPVPGIDIPNNGTSNVSVDNLNGFFEDFEAEGDNRDESLFTDESFRESNTYINVPSLSQFTIEGNVDLVGGNDDFGLECSTQNGLCIDLDGTGGTRIPVSTLTSNDIILDAGSYVFSFNMSGNDRIDASDTVAISVEPYLPRFELTVERNDPMQRFEFPFTVTGSGTTNIVFELLGQSDDSGPILDDVSLSSDATIIVLSNFDDGSPDGWNATVFETTLISTDGSCGLVQVDPDPGFLCTDPIEGDNDISYFVAPDKFKGDLTVFTKLVFDLVTEGGNFFSSGNGFVGDIFISNGSADASYVFEQSQRPTGEWTTYEIALNEPEKWVVSNDSTLEAILQNVTDLRIRAEYRQGDDNAGLDNISLE